MITSPQWRVSTSSPVAPGELNVGSDSAINEKSFRRGGMPRRPVIGGKSLGSQPDSVPYSIAIKLFP